VPDFWAVDRGTGTHQQSWEPPGSSCCLSLLAGGFWPTTHADTDAKKRDQFRRRLNTKLKELLNLVRADNFNELVNMAITQEDCILAHRAEKKAESITWTLEVTTFKVSVDSEPSSSSFAPKCSSRQMGS
jgi:hypothetical protein